MINKIKYKLINILRKRRILNSIWFKEMESNNKKIIHIGTPEHGNLGDHMIAIAGNKFFIDNYPDYKLYEITLNEYEAIKEELKSKIKEEDIICFIGGGHFGNLYLHHEIRRREIVENYSKNKIIFLPATLTFEGECGKKELRKSKEVYNKHYDITIMCREEESFKFAKQNFNNKIMLVPDMVNYLEGDNKKEYKIKQDVLFLLRKDKEKISNNNIFQDLKKNLSKENITFLDSDTHLGNETVGKGFREIYTTNLLKDIGQSKVIVTDRLHGMILGIISKKPVIAFNSLDGKVKKSYETWYKEYKNVDFSEGHNTVDLVKKLLNAEITIKEVTKEKLLNIIKGQKYDKK